MKRLICEMCGGTDLIKQDGVFVCQSCGVKYSLEEAKKMMVEGVVEVTGTVVVDDTDKIDNYYMLAMNEFELEHIEEAINYCKKILEIDNNNYKGSFLLAKIMYHDVKHRLPYDHIKSNIITNYLEKAIASATEDQIDEIKSWLYKLSSELYNQILKEASEESKRCKYKNEYRLGPSIVYSYTNKNFHIIIMRNYIIDVLFPLLKKCSIEIPDYFSTIDETIIKESKQIRLGKEKFLSRYDVVNPEIRLMLKIAMIETAISFTDENDLKNIPRYKELISLINESISMYYNRVKYRSEFDDLGYDNQEQTKKVKFYTKKLKELDPSSMINN